MLKLIFPQIHWLESGGYCVFVSPVPDRHRPREILEDVPCGLSTLTWAMIVGSDSFSPEWRCSGMVPAMTGHARAAITSLGRPDADWE